MTIKEKLMKKYPEVDEDYVRTHCPDMYGVMPSKKCKCQPDSRARYQTLGKSPKEMCDDCWNQKAGLSVWQLMLIICGVAALLVGLIGFGMHVLAYEQHEEPIDIYVEDTTGVPIETFEETAVEETTEEPMEEPSTSIAEPIETEPVVPAVRYFDVPLSEDLQNHIFAVCEARGVDPLLVVAMAKKESEFKYWEIGDNGNAFGLLQIWPYWHGARMERLGCPDLLDPYQNVIVGVDILAELFSTGRSLEWVLMTYNGGYAHANNHIANGTISYYAATVKNYMNTIERK